VSALGQAGLNISTARTGKSSWRFFMIAALCLLIGESLFADRIHGRNSKRASTPSPATPEVA